MGHGFGPFKGLRVALSYGYWVQIQEGYRVQPRVEVQTADGPEGPCPSSPTVV